MARKRRVTSTSVGAEAKRPKASVALTNGTRLSLCEHTYDGLEEENLIRLIYLLPGQADDPIRIRLETVNLASKPDYEAISYVWGDPTIQQAVYTPTGRINVTVNLYHALCTFRYADKERCLWADAVCVNQANKLERNHQVKQMADIFGGARTVLVWLGHDWNGLMEEAFTRVRLIAAAHPETTLLLEQDYFRRRCVDLLRTITGRSWFYRTWTRQEVGLASAAMVYCGDDCIPWDSLVRVFRLLITDPRLQDTVLSGWRSDTSRSFSELLDITRTCQCSDPRDRVFALLAHPSARQRRGDQPDPGLIVEPDYRKTKLQVYTEVARNIIKRSGNLELLSHKQRWGGSSFTPSWVPDWSTKYGNLPQITINSLGAFFACGHSLSDLYCKDMNSTLADDSPNFYIQGICKGRVASRLNMTYHILDPVYALGRTFNELEQIAISAQFQHVPMHNNPVAMEMLSRTITCNDGNLMRDIQSFWTWRLANEHHFIHPKPPRAELPVAMVTLLDQIYNVCSLRDIFFTDTGYIGIGPRDQQEECDQIFLLRGAKVPFLLREVGLGRYTVIGECYVDGIMYGEGVLDTDEIKDIILV